MNQVYLYAGTTLDARAYYRGRDSAKHYLFFDSNCGGGTVGADGKPTDQWRTGWFFGCGAPSLTDSSDLQGAGDGSCCNTANINTDSFELPIGRKYWWRWCGNQEDSGILPLNLVQQTNVMPSIAPTLSGAGTTAMPPASVEGELAEAKTSTTAPPDPDMSDDKSGELPCCPEGYTYT